MDKVKWGHLLRIEYFKGQRSNGIRDILKRKRGLYEKETLYFAILAAVSGGVISNGLIKPLLDCG